MGETHRCLMIGVGGMGALGSRYLVAVSRAGADDVRPGGRQDPFVARGVLPGGVRRRRAVLDRDHVVRIEERSAMGTLQTREAAPVETTGEGHQAIAAQFLDWLDGGPVPATTLEDNLQSTATLFGTIRASETGTAVDVQAVVRELGT